MRLKHIVERVLRKYPSSRSNDDILYKEIIGNYNYDIKEIIEIKGLVSTICNIRRYRAKIQSLGKYPAKKSVREKRLRLYNVYKKEIVNSKKTIQEKVITKVLQEKGKTASKNKK